MSILDVLVIVVGLAVLVYTALPIVWYVASAPVPSAGRMHLEALEAEKHRLLNHIHDLEHEVATGKLTQEDFEPMARGVKLEAAAILKQIDEARAELAEEPAAAEKSAGPSACTNCGTEVSSDDAFCRKCGQAL